MAMRWAYRVVESARLCRAAPVNSVDESQVAQERGKLLSKLIDAKGVVVVSYDAIVRHFIKASRVEDELVRIVSQV